MFSLIRKSVLLLVLGCVITSCESNKYAITIDTSSLHRGDVVLLSSIDKNKHIGIRDSALVDNTTKNILFEGITNEPKIGYLTLRGTYGDLDIIVEPGEIKVEVYRDSIFKSKVFGTKSNEEMNLYKRMLRPYNTQIEIAKVKLYKDTIDSAQAKIQFEQEVQKIQKKITQFQLRFIQEHPKSYVSLLLIDILVKQKDIDKNTLRAYFNMLSSSLRSSSFAKHTLSSLE